MQPPEMCEDQTTIARQVIQSIHAFIPILMKPLCKFLPDSHRPRYSDFMVPGPALACTSVIVNGYREHRLTGQDAFQTLTDSQEIVDNRRRVPLTLDKQFAFLKHKNSALQRLVDFQNGATADIQVSPPTEMSRWWWLPSKRIIIEVQFTENLTVTFWLPNGRELVVHDSWNTVAGVPMPKSPDGTVREDVALRLTVSGDDAVLTFWWQDHAESWKYRLDAIDEPAERESEPSSYLSEGLLGAELELVSLCDHDVLLRSWDPEEEDEPVVQEVHETPPTHPIFSRCCIS